MELLGHCSERWAPVREALEQNFETHGDVGASVAVSFEGEMVVDLWGGHSDAAGTTPWAADTLVNVYSTTKTMTFLSALMLADHGEIELYEPVASYWPEFAANGKRDVEVRHLLSHSAGLPGLDEPCTLEQLYDWDWMCARLAAQAPWWTPGTQSGYHALTQGYLIGEVVRRVTGQTLGSFFRREIAQPLGVDFYIGTPESVFPRIGELIPPPQDESPQAVVDPDSIAGRTFATAPLDARDSATPGWRKAEIPAANGHGNARAVVRAQTLLANGGEAWGKRLMSDQGVGRIFDEQTNGEDLVLGVPIRFGMGFGLNSEVMPLGPNPRTCFWGGWGGSLVVIDQDARVCFSYVMNRMMGGLVGDQRGFGISQAVYRSLAG